jgi:hypothetical protein
MMAGSDIGEEIVEQVMMVRPIPQVVLGIDQGETGIESGLGRLLGFPCCIRRQEPSAVGVLRRCPHVEWSPARVGRFGHGA